MKLKGAINIAIIGDGSEAMYLVPTLNECQSINVVGFCDPMPNPANAAIAQEHNIPLLDKIEQLPSIGDVDLIIDLSNGKVAISSVNELKSVEIICSKGADIIRALAANNKSSNEDIGSILVASREFASKSDSQSLYQAITENALKITGCSAGTLIIFNERNETCRLAGMSGYSKYVKEPVWELQPGGITERLLDVEDPIFIEDINKEPLFDNPIMNEGTISVLATALKDGEEVVGLLFVGDFKARQFSDREIKMFASFASQASLALQKAILLEKNEELTITDNLTRLNNNRHFLATLDNEMGRVKRYGGHFAILLMDVDGLDDINNYFGHSKGDWALKKIAEVLVACSRQTDYKARYGGDEFVMLLPNTDCTQAAILANRIRRQVADIAIRDGREGARLSMSIGIAEFPCLGTNCDELMNAVSTALYICKQRGKNLVCCYEDTGESPDFV